jgi:AhpD family alkylhydroperoxidase
VLLTVSHENGCEYCVAAHSFLADAVSKVPRSVTAAIRAGAVIPDPRLRALSDFTRIVVANRGLPSRPEVQAFLAAGYTERHVLEVVLAIAVKTLSNYANHLSHTGLDPVFGSHAWRESALAPSPPDPHLRTMVPGRSSTGDHPRPAHPVRNLCPSVGPCCPVDTGHGRAGYDRLP